MSSAPKIQKVFLSGRNAHTAIQCLREAAQNHGSFVVKGSAVSDYAYIRKRVVSQLDKFYKLPLQQKLKVGNLSGKGATRGYFPIGSESGNKDLFEKKESFSFGYNDSLVTQQVMQHYSLAAPNIWPEQFDSESFLQLLENFNKTALQLLQVCSKAFDYDFMSVYDHTSLWQNFMRSFRYYGPSVEDE